MVSDSAADEVRVLSLNHTVFVLAHRGYRLCFVQESLKLCFSDPSQAVDQLPKLMDKILSLMENSSDVDKTLDQTTELATREM